MASSGGTGRLRRSGPAVVLLGVAQVLVVFDTTMFAMGLPWIMARAGLTVSGLTWLLTVYSVCFAALPALAAALGEAFGQRRVLTGGLVLSTLAAVVPAVSSDASLLLWSRAVQGIAAAVVTAGALALIDAAHPAGPGRDRALSVHFVVVAAALPAVLLPAVLLLDAADDGGTAFWVQAVASAVLLLLTPVVLTETTPVPGAARRVGSAARWVVPLGFLAWFADWLGNHSVSLETVVLIAVAGALLPSLVAWLGRGERMPELFARLYRQRAAVGAYTVVTLVATCLAGLLLVLSLSLQLLGAMSPLQVGWAMLPAVAGIVLGWLVLPVLAARIGVGFAVAGACAVAAAGFLVLSLRGAAGFGEVVLPLLLVAFGCGVLALPVGFARSGSGARPQGLNASRQLGAGLGASLFPGILTVVQQEEARNATGMKAYRSFVAHGAHDCFQLGVALSLAATVVALLTLTRVAPAPEPEPEPEPGVSGGAPAGTAGSPGS
ncbi:MFS transporter [Streptomyces sp. NPDC048106]|uniref:MFS transporter n=1 Tax=Streptomyces sp. NPDC048106 TaxID=3155750 RepID=UPI0034532805